MWGSGEEAEIKPLYSALAVTNFSIDTHTAHISNYQNQTKWFCLILYVPLSLFRSFKL